MPHDAASQRGQALLESCDSQTVPETWLRGGMQLKLQSVACAGQGCTLVLFLPLTPTPPWVRNRCPLKGRQ